MHQDTTTSLLSSLAIQIICDALHCKPCDIQQVYQLKKGITNISFVFSCKGKSYVLRIPGEGTDVLLNRKEEYAVYQAIKGKNLCEEVISFNPNNGYKISEFIGNARSCNAFQNEDLNICMQKLKTLHNMKLQVPHTFDFFEKIDFYESLFQGKSIYEDYAQTKANILKLKPFLDEHHAPFVLSHIDPNCDNFLFSQNNLYLIDWEYAGMQDPHVDLAAFATYSYYTKAQIDNLINIYFEHQCPPIVRKKIYAYVAIVGLAWSNWCEYKRMLGIEFSEYASHQYRYAKNYYQHFLNQSAEA